MTTQYEEEYLEEYDDEDDICVTTKFPIKFYTSYDSTTIPQSKTALELTKLYWNTDALHMKSLTKTLSTEDLEVSATFRTCLACLSMDVKMFPVRDYKLRQMYEELTRIDINYEDNLPKMLCWECVGRLQSIKKMRDKAIRAYRLLTSRAGGDTCVTVKDIKSINRQQNKLESTLTTKQFGDDDINLTICVDEQNVVRETENIDEDFSDNEVDVPRVVLQVNGEEVFLEEDTSGDEGYLNGGTTVEGNESGGTEVNSVRKEYVNEDARDEAPRGEVTKRKLKRTNQNKRQHMALKNPPLKGVNGKKRIQIPSDVMAIFKASPLKQRDNRLDKTLFTVTRLSYDEQIAEMEGRKESESYKWAPWKCTECYQVFPERHFYNAHMIRHSKENRPYECFICKLRYKTRTTMRGHLTTRHCERLSCNLCPFVTRDRSVAKRHEKFHAGIKYQCPHCSKEFEKETTYRSHLRLKHVSRFVCELCGFVFVSANGVLVHKRKAHAGELRDGGEVVLRGPYCEPCDVRFVSAEAYKHHLLLSSLHTNDNDPSRLRNDYQNIKRVKYSGAKKGVDVPRAPLRPRRSIACEQCGKRLSDFPAYSQHFARDHPGMNRTKHPPTNKQQMCELCGKIFLTKFHYKAHLWVHTGEKGYKCDICGKSLSTKSNLIIHIRGHSSPRPAYPCPVCNKHFLNYGNRKRHMLIHTGLKPFKCVACEKCFKTMPERVSHYDHVHLRKPWPKRVRPRAADNSDTS